MCTLHLLHPRPMQVINSEASLITLVVSNVQVPEMARRELTGALLQLKALGVDSLAEFDFLSPPPPELAAKAVEALHVLGALDADARCFDAADSSRPDGMQLAAVRGWGVSLQTCAQKGQQVTPQQVSTAMLATCLNSACGQADSHVSVGDSLAVLLLVHLAPEACHAHANMHRQRAWLGIHRRRSSLHAG
jgi:HrpA-like RNA helicase